jgi:hypothetical protein
VTPPAIAPDLTVRASDAPVAAAAPVAVAVAPHPKRRIGWWAWTLIGVAAAGAIAGGVTVGILESRPSSPQPGSLGLLDGRR